MLTSPTLRVLLALAAGLALGAALAAVESAALPAVVAVATPVGTLWVNAIRSTVIPLVVALLVTGVAAAEDAGALGRVGRGAAALFAAMLVGTASFATLVAAPLMARLPLGAAAAALQPEPAAAAALSAKLPGFDDWLVGLVPVNPVAAAAEGALLPLVVFTLVFALAATRVAPSLRGELVAVFQGVKEAVLVMVRWVLWLAPLGVFALALPLGARAGFGAAGALASFVGVVAAVCLAVVAALYVLAVTVGRVSLRRFARAAAPAQAVAFSSRSSIAALPAMVQGAERQLAAPPAVTGFFLPFAVASFKPGATVAIVTGPLFLAHLYSVPLSGVQLATVAVAAVLLSFGVPGVPGGVILVMAPVLAGVGIPAEGLGVLLAVDTVPDMFRTLANATANMASAAVLSRGAPAGGGGRGGSAAPVGP